jgi:hypothetical protein
MMARRARKRDDNRARYVLSGELCGREDCESRVEDGYPPLVLRQFRDYKDDSYGGDSGVRANPNNLHDVVVNLCVKDRRALALGLWVPTRQELIEHWKPTEKQIHPVVQGALNRDHFYVPPFQWLKEIRIHGLANTNIVDLACFVWKQGYSEEASGVHAFEIKMKENGDNKRLTAQLGTMLETFHFAWLIRVDADPQWDFDKRVGLMRYDLRDDKITRVRQATRLRAVKDPEPYRYFQEEAEAVIKRVKAQGSMENKTLNEVLP